METIPVNKCINIAVLLSTYNGEKYIAEQIDSILAQQGTFSIHLFIRDDGSKDNTCKILKEYEKENRVHTFYEENVGITESYFRLIHIAKELIDPDYYSLSDQDDVWLPEKLSCALNLLETEKRSHKEEFPVLYGCQSYIVNEKLEKTGQLTQKQLRPLTICNTAIQNILLGHNQVFNSALAKELCSKELDYRKIYAHDMWITQVASIKGKVVFENVPHTLYRQHGENELGYGSGAGTWKWIVARIKRTGKGESRLVGQQTRYLISLYKYLGNQMDTIESILDPANNFVLRGRYSFTGLLYRQRKAETGLFYVLYILNKYGIKK